jgi:SAM-dependent methyltransferase
MPRDGLDAHASSYEAEIRRSIAFAGQEHDFYVEAKARRLVELGNRHLGGLDEADALDVGCGIGLTDRFVVDRVRQLHGTDLSPAMLERARETNPAVRYELCEPGALPYPEERFDLVFAICVLHHVPALQRAAFIGEIRRVTRSGGMVVLFEHNPWNPLTRLAVRSCTLDDDVELLARRELRELLENARLDIVDAAFLLFTPWRGRVMARLDRALAPLPAGAQYFVAARRLR